MTTPTAPTIHLNGTSADSLLDAYGEAMLAIDGAYAAVKETAPNGRDYYVKPGSMDLATAEHMDRLRRLDAVKNELEQIMEAIIRQQKD